MGGGGKEEEEGEGGEGEGTGRVLGLFISPFRLLRNTSCLGCGYFPW